MTENSSNALFYRIANDILLTHEAGKPALDYFAAWNISPETLKRFKIGYTTPYEEEEGIDEDARKLANRVIFPRSDTAYTAIQLNRENKYSEVMTEGESTLYELNDTKSKIVFLTQSELDALALIEAGAPAVLATGSIQGLESKLIEEVIRRPSKVYVLAFNYDKEGAALTDGIREQMAAAGQNNYIRIPLDILWEDKGSASDYLREKPEYMKAKIRSLAEAAEEARAEADFETHTGEEMINAFLETVQTTRNFEPIPTGIETVDTMLEGGFIRKTLVMLGAPPAMGKTALAQQIFESIAAAGRSVLYINLEMAREQLIARSLARIAYEIDYRAEKLSPLDILRGYQWTEAQRTAVLNAAGKYRKNIAPRILYNPDESAANNRLSKILTAIDNEMLRAEDTGKEPPLICIDYLQLIDAEERDAIEGMKKAIKALKDLAIKYNTVVFCIMANNRESNKAGKAEMESGRDTSAIEYSADVMLGLSYTAIEEKLKYRYKKGNTEITKAYDLEAIRYAKSKHAALADDITLKVLKSRFSEGGRKCYFHFNGEHNHFHPMKQRYYIDDTERKPLMFDEEI